MRKIQLINAPNEVEVHKSGSASYYPHLGLISIATHLKNKRPDLELEVIDGSITPLEEILERVEGEVVGVSVLTPTYNSGLRIAQKAKEKGATTVFGNDHATNLHEQVLSNRPEVDYVIAGDYGEVPLEFLLKGLEGKFDIGRVPNLAYRKEGRVVVNKGLKIDFPGANLDSKGFMRFPMNSLPIPDRSLVEKQEEYMENYRKDHGEFHDGEVRQTTINIARGCGWGESDKRRCSFCDIYDLTKRTVSPERAWEEVRQLVEREGYNFLYEVCDDFSSFVRGARGKPSYVEELLKTKPSGLSPKWFVYSRASELSKRNTVDLLKRLNVKRANIGVDSADDNVLRGMSKGASEDINRRAIQNCADADMQMYVSFVFGSIGETQESLDKTYRFIEEIVDTDHIVAIDPSVLLPLPNSPSWRYMMNPLEGSVAGRQIGYTPRYLEDFQKKYGSSDTFDTDELARDYVKTFCNCSYEDIIEVRDKILDLQKEKGFVFGGFGVRGF